MILNDKKKDVAVCGVSEQSQFSIQADAKAFNILSSNIYTHKERAVIRELSCNAHDAHIEAGNPDPFKVHLPTHLEPWFSVRDFGTGLSHEDCMKLYTTYFASTKTESNDVIGCLGIGSKSPYAVADSFTVISRYNGVERTYTAYKDENDLPQFALLLEQDTDECNGLEVKVNVEGNLYLWTQEAVNVFRYFSYIPDINVKSVIESITRDNKYNIVANDYKIGSGYGNAVAVMGNVAYEIPDSIDLIRANAVIYFPLGSLNFDPGRESLTLDTKTKETVLKRMEEIKANIKQEVIKQIESEPTAFKQARKTREFLSCGISRLLNNADFFKYTNTPKVNFQHYRVEGWKTTATVDTSFDSLPQYKDERYFIKERGLVSRIRANIARNDHFIVMTQEEFDKSGIDPEFLEPLDNLEPAQNHYSYSSSTSVARSKVAEFKSYNRKDRLCWQDAEVDIDSTERVYVEIHRYIPKSHNRYFNSNFQIHQSLKDLCEYITVPTVYGLKHTFINTRDFKKGNWIKLEDYVKRELSKAVPEVIYTYNGKTTLFKKLHSFGIQCELLQKFNDMLVIYDNQIPATLLQNAGVDIDNIRTDDTMDSLAKEIYQKFPMLNFVRQYEENKESLSFIKSYMETKNGQNSST